jgi:hypothetical protein
MRAPLQTLLTRRDLAVGRHCLVGSVFSVTLAGLATSFTVCARMRTSSAAARRALTRIEPGRVRRRRLCAARRRRQRAPGAARVLCDSRHRCARQSGARGGEDRRRRQHIGSHRRHIRRYWRAGRADQGAFPPLRARVLLCGVFGETLMTSARTCALQLVKEMVEVPLLSPELFTKFGLRPPKVPLPPIPPAAARQCSHRSRSGRATVRSARNGQDDDCQGVCRAGG